MAASRRWPRSTHAIEEVCVDADIVIGAVLVVGAKAPKLISDDLVGAMRDGSVLVDISVDQGGCFESTRPTTHSDPTFEVNGSVFYCVANMPGAVPHSSTHALVNATLPYVLQHRQPRVEGRGGRGPGAGRGGQRRGGDDRLRARGRGPRHWTTARCRSSSDPAPVRRPRPPRCHRPDQPRPSAVTDPGPSGPWARWSGSGDAGGQVRGRHRVEAHRTEGYLTGPHGSPRSSSSSPGGPALTLTDASSRARRSTLVAAVPWSTGTARSPTGRAPRAR